MGKRLISLTLCGALITGVFSGNNLAKAEIYAVDSVANEKVMLEVAAGIKNESTDKLLEAALKAAKSKIEIPKEYSEFNYYYYGGNIYSNAYWSLNWRNPKDYSYIEINLDKDNNITYYYKYDRSSSNKGIPSYLKKELLEKAKEFIKKISPEVYLNMEYIDASYNGVYSNTYSYHFQRKERGVLLPDNNVTVMVDASTGEVRSASIEWLYDAKIPSADIKLTKDEAAKIIGENLNMKLTYKTNYYRIFDNGQNKLTKKAFLVYEPDISYISVDAKTGEVYLTKSEWHEIDFGNGATSGNKTSAKDADGGVNDNLLLTEEEISKLNELGKMITKEKAIETVISNPYLYIDKNLLTYSASLSKSYSDTGNDSSYVWNIELKDERPVDYENDQFYYRAYAYATVDAKTGKILSFNASIKDNYDQKAGKWVPVDIKYDREYGKNVFEKFLKSQINDLFKNTKLVSQRDDYIAYYKENFEPVYGGYYYTYNRYNEDVEFPYNGIYGAVDGVTGKIYSYYSYWDDDIVFESPKNAMSAKEAFEHYISKDGFNLIYEINSINQYDPNYKANDLYHEYSEAYKVAYEIRLVYRPDINPRFISPFTGEQLNGNGEVYQGSNAYVYEDLTDTESNRQILLLSDMGVGFNDKYFSPDKTVTEGEVIRIFEDLGYYDYESENNKNSEKMITREELAYNLIKRLGYEKVSKISGIYKTGYYDENNINHTYLGAVALARGLKLFPESENNNFNPRNNVTRKDLVQLIFNYIKAENDLRY